MFTGSGGGWWDSHVKILVRKFELNSLGVVQALIDPPLYKPTGSVVFIISSGATLQDSKSVIYIPLSEMTNIPDIFTRASPPPPPLPPPRVTSELKQRQFETRTATGRKTELLLVCSELNQSVGKPSFKYFKLNTTSKRSVANGRAKKYQLPAAVRVSKTSLLEVPNGHGRRERGVMTPNDDCEGILRVYISSLKFSPHFFNVRIRLCWPNYAKEPAFFF